MSLPDREHKTQAFRSTSVAFLGEQEGSPERELKTRLSQWLDGQPDVTKAYLARVGYPESIDPSVALCLKVRSDTNNLYIVENVGAIFSSLFGMHEHLDIIFLSEEQETQLAKICKDFL